MKSRFPLDAEPTMLELPLQAKVFGSQIPLHNWKIKFGGLVGSPFGLTLENEI